MFNNLRIEFYRPRRKWPYAVGVGFLLAVFLFVQHTGFLETKSSLSSFAHRVLEQKSPYSLLAKGGDVAFPPPPAIIFPSPPRNTTGVQPPKDLSAPYILVKDRSSGAVLFSKAGYDKHSLASITKLMSALVVLEYQPVWTATTTVATDTVEDAHLLSGEMYTLHDLWNSALVGSSNKAILSLADATGLSRDRFVARMNQKAAELSMTSTVFVDPTGLDAGNQASAENVSALLQEALKHPEIQTAVTTREYTASARNSSPSHHMWNTDWLLLGWIPNTFHAIHGGKTGFIPNAGYNFTVSVEDRNGHTIDIAVLGASSNESRFTDARDIGDWVFSNFVWSTSTLSTTTTR